MPIPSPTAVVRLLVLRGRGDTRAVAVRPEFKIVSGRMFRSGARELVIGVASQQGFRNLDVGDKVPMQDGEWPIVGSFCHRRRYPGRTVVGRYRHPDGRGPAQHLQQRDRAIGRTGWPGGLCSTPLRPIPGLGVRVERQSDYYARTSR